jgi:hypothetical protein
LHQYSGKITGNIFVFIFGAYDYRNRMLLALLPLLFAVKGNAAVEKAIIKNLDKCSKTEKVENNFPQMIPQYYPIHKQWWFGG